MKVFQILLKGSARANVGDNLTQDILKWLGVKDIEITNSREDTGKFIGCGSLMTMVRNNDTVWGTGIHRQVMRRTKEVKVLAVRGKLSRKMLMGYGHEVPEIYGDPAVLLPLIYNPKVKPTYDVGHCPHYIDTKLVKPQIKKNELFIDVLQEWKSFVDQILRCKTIISSSLHGLIIAEAYGRKAIWANYSGRILGGQLKYHDYLIGTERDAQDYGELPKLDSKVLENRQKGLIKAFKENIS